MHDIQPSPSPALCPWSAGDTISHFGGDEALVRELIALFVASCPRHLQRLRRLLLEGDLPALAKAAHAVKGSLSNFTSGAPMTTAAELERLCHLGRREAAGERLVRLERELEALVAAMQAFQGEAS